MNLEELSALLRSSAPMTTAERTAGAAELERVHALLVDLTIHDHFGRGAETGEGATRRVQRIAADALGRAR